MVEFDASNFTVQHVQLKSCTTALGGSVSIVDEQKSTKDKEVYKKISIPRSVARQFIKLYHMRKYLSPVPAALVWYGDVVVTVERHPASGLAQNQKWTPNASSAIEALKRLTQRGKWYIDGLYVYQPRSGQRNQRRLSSDGRFVEVSATAYKLSSLSMASDKVVEEQTRSCLMYVSKHGDQVVSPPIWKSLNRVGVRQLAYTGPEDDAEDADDVMAAHSTNTDNDDDYQFDRIDQYLAVNLGFVLRAGKELSEQFGFDSIEPLRLDKLMVQLNTVNLPSLPKHVKQTYDTGMPFTFALAWLLGFLGRVDTIEAQTTVRELLLYLTTRGIYRKNPFDTESVFVGDEHVDVPQLTREQIENGYDIQHVPAQDDAVLEAVDVTT